MTDFARPDGTLDLEALRYHGLLPMHECVDCAGPTWLYGFCPACRDEATRPGGWLNEDTLADIEATWNREQWKVIDGNA